ncbi:MAG: DUF3800 domain-containing protein [Hyphomicrobium sp.]
MLTAYFDDSHSHAETKTVTLAGYVSLAENWKGFENQSRELFRSDGVKLFHAKEFDGRKGCFKGWTMARQLRFITDWLDIASTTVMCGFSISVLKADYHKARSETGLAQSISPYGYCFEIALRRMCANGHFWSKICEQGMSIIIEAGNPGNQGIRVDFERIIAEHNRLQGKIHALDFNRKDSSQAIQLADFLAYYSGKRSERLASGQSIIDQSYLDIALVRMPTDMGLYREFYRTPNF